MLFIAHLRFTPVGMFISCNSVRGGGTRNDVWHPPPSREGHETHPVRRDSSGGRNGADGGHADTDGTIGVVRNSAGSATVTRGGNVLPATTGTRLHTGDILGTGPD